MFVERNGKFYNLASVAVVRCVSKSEGIKGKGFFWNYLESSFPAIFPNLTVWEDDPDYVQIAAWLSRNTIR